MATSYQRRPDGKAPQPQQVTPQKVPQALEAELQKVDERKRVLEQREEGAGLDADAAAKLQPSMGNAAIAGMLNRATDTASGAAGEAALEEQREEEKEEEGEEKEAGEVEHVLPSFTTGGGGGGAQPPWAMGRMMGGDDDGDAPVEEVVETRWRPMPVLPDPDEDAELEEVEGEDAPDDPDAVDLTEANAALGEAPWKPRLLTRGLRHARHLARREFGPEVLVDTDGLDNALGRARAMLRFVAVHGDGLDAVLLARAATGASEAIFAQAGGYAGAVARGLALAEVAVAVLPPDWVPLLEVVADGRARARVENVAAEVANAGALAATTLFGVVMGVRAAPAPVDLVLACHPAASAALSAAARLDPLPLVDLWSPPERADGEDDALDAVDAILARFTGAPEPAGEGILVADVEALFASMNALLGAIGGALVEMAAAGVALAPFLPLPEIVGVLTESEGVLRRAARRLVGAGESLERLVGTREEEQVRRVSAEALAVRSTVEVARQGAVATLGALLVKHEPAPPELPELLERAEVERLAGHTETARGLLDAAILAAPPELEGRVALAAAGALCRMGFDEGGRFGEAAAALGAGALAAAAHCLAAGHALARERWDVAAAHATEGFRLGEARELPFVVADASCTLATVARATGGDWRAPLRAGAAVLRGWQEGGALNLLKARWGEMRTR